MPALVAAWLACAPPPVDVARLPAARVAAGAWPLVQVNEVLPGNDSISSDEALDFDDWVELYNPTDAAVSLDGWGLADDLGDPDWTFPPGVAIEPRGHLVVWLDGEPEEGPLHASFSVGRDGDELALFSPDGALVDALTWGPLPSDVVFGRFPSGGPFRAPSIVATPLNGNPVDPGVSLDPSEALFPDDEVVKLELFLDDEAVDALLRDNSEVVRAGLAFEGAYLPDVELRIKGAAGSNRAFDQKAAFKIDLDEHAPGRRLRGLEKLTLNNMVQDASGVHEWLGYQLFRGAGVPAPRAAHVELWLNGQYRGLYLNVETVDDQFLKRWFADPDGNLYEGEYGEDVNPSSLSGLERDEAGANDVADGSDVAALAAFLAQPPSEDRMPELEARVDLDRTLKMLAGEVVIGHWDGYFYYPNNWRIYHEPTLDQWTLLVSGIDQTFDWEGDPHAASGDLAAFCLAIPSCRTRYDLALWDMAERMTMLDCAEQVPAAIERLRDLYDRDPFRESDVSGMRSSAEDTIAYCETTPYDVLARLFPEGVPGP